MVMAIVVEEDFVLCGVRFLDRNRVGDRKETLECGMRCLTTQTRPNGTARNRATTGTIPIGGRIGTLRKSPTSSSPKIEPYAIFGGGAGEGLAAMRGHQSGVQGMRVAMPVFSREIETVRGFILPLPGAPPAYSE